MRKACLNKPPVNRFLSKFLKEGTRSEESKTFSRIISREFGFQTNVAIKVEILNDDSCLIHVIVMALNDCNTEW